MTEQSEKQVPTTEKLARALEKANAPQTMIEQARAGYYDDYKSKLTMPIARLVQDSQIYARPTNGLLKIARRAMNGEFDAQSWESDEWASSPEGQATFAEFGHLLPKDH